MKGPRLIVRALLVDEGRLLVNFHEGRLALFGGRVEKGETARRALERELVEELGLRVELGRLAYVVENFFVDGRERRIHELGLYYRARSVRPLGTAPVEPREKELRPAWLPLAELASSELRPRSLRDHLAAHPFHEETVDLIEIDRVRFAEVLG